MVEEFPAVVGMETQERHGEGFADTVHGTADALLALAPHGLQLGPAGRDVDGEERGEKEAVRAGPAVREQVRLHVARLHVGPLAEGAHGHLGPHRRETRAGRGDAVAPMEPAHGPQEPIERGGTDLHQERCAAPPRAAVPRGAPRPRPVPAERAPSASSRDSRWLPTRAPRRAAVSSGRTAAGVPPGRRARFGRRRSRRMATLRSRSVIRQNSSNRRPFSRREANR